MLKNSQVKVRKKAYKGKPIYISYSKIRRDCVISINVIMPCLAMGAENTLMVV